MKQKLKRIIKQPFVVLLCLWYTLAWSWAFITDSLDLAGSKPVAMAIAAWVVVFNVAISTYIVVKTFKFLTGKFKKQNPWIVLVVGFPIFALMDYAISWLTAIIWIGPEGSIDNVLPLSSPTLLLVNTPFKYATRFVGFYGLAGFFWLITFLILEKKWRKYALICIAFLAGLSVVGWQLYKTPNGKELKATVISENLDNHVGVMQSRDSELIVFPEYGLDEITNDNISKRVGKNRDGSKQNFLGSQQIFDGSPSGHLNILLFGNTEKGIISSQEKYRLIPGGEDLGYIVRTALRATNQKSTLDYFSYAKMVNKGKHPVVPIKVDDSATLGSAVCSSIIAPKDYQIFALKGATIFTNSASLTIFKGSRVFAWQQKSLARFMAVANSRYFLQSANAATAYALDNNGKQIAEVRGIEAKDVIVRNNTKKTFYTYAGDWLVAIGMLIVAGWLLIKLKNLNKKKPKSKKQKTKASKNSKI